MRKMIKLLIVDDSALMRRHLTGIFKDEGDFELMTAHNGVEALQALHAFQPDVITLDINMPDMDGLTCLSRIMVERPCPVVMVSSLTEKGALATLEAMAMGAVDFIPKPGGTISLSLDRVRDELVKKVRAAARAKIHKGRGPARQVRASGKTVCTDRDNMARPTNGLPGVVLIGVSTGGPRTLEEILPGLPPDFPWPVVVAQHMPASFTDALARRMDGICALPVSEVASPTLLEAGHIYIGRGDADVVLSKRLQGITAVIRPENAKRLWHPSVDELVLSAMDHFAPQQIIGVLLTGMGHDGAEAMAALRKQGGRTIAESEESAVVFGMPAALIAKDGANLVLPAGKIRDQLLRWLC